MNLLAYEIVFPYKRVFVFLFELNCQKVADLGDIRCLGPLSPEACLSRVCLIDLGEVVACMHSSARLAQNIYQTKLDNDTM